MESRLEKKFVYRNGDDSFKFFLISGMFKEQYSQRTVNSIYFDTDIYQDVWDNINGFGNRKKIRINTLPLHLGKKIVGSFGGGGDPAKDIFEINKLIKSKKELDLLLGSEFNLKNINQPIQKMIKNKLILKPIINFKK